MDVIAEFGQVALILALLVAVAQAILPMVGAYRRDARLMAFGDRAAIAQFVLVAVAFVAITIVFVTPIIP